MLDWPFDPWLWYFYDYWALPLLLPDTVQFLIGKYPS
jgi:hypothetical protein